MKKHNHTKPALIFVVLIVLLLAFSVYFTDNVHRLTGFAVVDDNLTNQTVEETFGIQPNVTETNTVENTTEEAEQIPIEEPVNDTLPAEPVVEELIIEEPSTPEEPAAPVEEPPAPAGKGGEEETFTDQGGDSGEEMFGAMAGGTVTGCNFNITSSGLWEMSSDIGPCSDMGIKINVSDVILDCKGHSITGSNQASSAGIRSGYFGTDVKNITIVNCNVSNFIYGYVIYRSNETTLVHSKSSNNNGTIVQQSDTVNILNYSSQNDYGIQSGPVKFTMYLDGSSSVEIIQSDFNNPALTSSDYDIISINAGLGNKAWLNNFYYGGIYAQTGNLSYCGYVSEPNFYTFNDYYGNYFDTANIPVEHILTGSCLTLAEPYVRGSLEPVCGVQVTDDITLTRDLRNYTGGDICNELYALNITALNVDIDCQGNRILGNGCNLSLASAAIYSVGNDAVTATRCDIFNFCGGFIDMNATGGGVTNSEIHANTSFSFIYATNMEAKNLTVHGEGVLRNITDSTVTEVFFNATANSEDLFLSSSALDNDIYKNYFNTRGIAGHEFSNNYCINSQGNFYIESIGENRIGDDDCGPINLTTIPSNASTNRNVSSVAISWTDQTVVLPSQSMTYHLNITDALTGAIVYEATQSSPYSLSTSGIANKTYNILVRAYDGSVYATNKSIINLHVLNDADQDGRLVTVDDCDDDNASLYLTISAYPTNDNDGDLHNSSVLEDVCTNGTLPAGYSGVPGDDCDDNDASVHGGSTESNSQGNCNDGKDNDCDGAADWDDPDCGGGFDSDAVNYSFSGNINQAQNLKIWNSYGMIYFAGHTINMSGVDLNLVTLANNYIAVDESLTRLNDLAAIISFYDISYQKTPVILRDGVAIPCPGAVCTSIPVCTSSPKQCNVTIAGFSAYTTANNSQLHIYDQNDTEGGSKLAESLNMISFYANYTQTADGKPIDDKTSGNDPILGVWDNGTCVLTLPGDMSPTPVTTMEFNDVTHVYETRVFVNKTGIITWNVSCESKEFEPLNLSDTIDVFTDLTDPIRPIIYRDPYPENSPESGENPFYSGISTSQNIKIAGYVNESNASLNITVLFANYSFNFTTNSTLGSSESLLQGSEVIVAFNASAGQNVFFVNESDTALNAFRPGYWVQFTGHNRTFFKRYNISSIVDTGDDYRVTLHEELEADVAQGEVADVYPAEVPSGWFLETISLIQNGSNRITVEAYDLTGNDGPSSVDFITLAPGDNEGPVFNLSTVPDYVNTTTPTVNYTITDASGVNDSTLTVLRCHNETGTHIRFDGSNGTFARDFVGIDSATIVNGTVVPGIVNEAIYLNGTSNSYIEIGTMQAFSVFNGTIEFWFKLEDNPQGKASSTGLWTNLDTLGVGKFEAVYCDNNTGKMRVFGYNGVSFIVNLTSTTDCPIDEWTHVAYTWNQLGNRTLYLNGVAEDSNFYIFPTALNYHVIGNLTNGTFDEFAVYNQSLPASVIQQHYLNGLSGLRYCGDTSWNLSGDYYQTSLSLAYGTYDILWYVEDILGQNGTGMKQITVLPSSPFITIVNDQDDITYDTWLYFNWTVSGNEADVDHYEYSFGTAPYPDAGYNAYMSNQTAYLNKSVNLSSPTDFTIKTDEIYYLSVLVVDKLGRRTTPLSSDGILFVDATPPQYQYVQWDSAYTNSNSSLHAEWNFTDPESDIVAYEYAIGTKPYPQPGFENIIPRTLISGSLNEITKSGLNLIEGQDYYFTIRARNGNQYTGYNGTWSSYFSTPGIVIDTIAPINVTLRYNSTNLTINFTELAYRTGTDLSGAANVSGVDYGVIEVSMKPINLTIPGMCPDVYADFDPWKTVAATGLGEMITSVNLTPGYCHVFRLTVFDHAGNARTTPLATPLLIVLADTTPPTNVLSIIDDGFYTNNKHVLHANWSQSTDPETDVGYYEYRILRQSDTSDPSKYCPSFPSNCDEIAAGNVSWTAITRTDLNLTHGQKYFFEVYAVNGIGTQSTSAGYSDGILFLDNTAPDQVQVYQINNDTTSARWFVNDSGDGIGVNITMNFTGETYTDCRLLKQDLDYTTAADQCNETPAGSGVYACINSTAGDTDIYGQVTPDGQGTFTWYISCADSVGNGQTHLQNTHVTFTVDYPEAPKILLNITPVNATAANQLTCNGQIIDTDEGENISQANVTWRVEGAIVKSEIASVANNLTSSTLNSGYVRGQNVSCNISVMDQFGLNGSNVTSIEIQNSPPPPAVLIAPANGQAINSVFEFQQQGADSDGDHLTYELKFMNSTHNESTLSYSGPTAIVRPGNQDNVSVYENIVAFADDRSGNSDIYTYDLDTGVETLLVTGSKDQTMPIIYKDYVVYAQKDPATTDLYLINRNTAVKKLLKINTSYYDIFEDNVVYVPANRTGVYLYDISADTTTLIRDEEVRSIDIYGDSITWYNTSFDLIYYDLINNKSFSVPNVRSPKLFGNYIVFGNESADIFYIDVHDQIINYLAEKGGFAIYGDQISYSNRTGSIYDLFVFDIEQGNKTMIYSGDLASLDIYKNSIVISNNSDLLMFDRIFKIPGNTYFGEDLMSYSFTFNSTNSPDGYYNWTVVTCDSAITENNSCVQSEIRSFILDNTPPAINITNPLQGKAYSHLVNLDVTIADLINISRVNYSIYYTNGTVFNGYNDVELNNPYSTTIDFTPLGVNGTDNFSIVVQAADILNNTNTSTVNISVDNRLPFFDFVAFANASTVSNALVINYTITDDFEAGNALTSTLTIYDPSSNIKFKDSQTTATEETHTYSDNISISGWDDGLYTVVFEGNNTQGSNNETRYFIVDDNFPVPIGMGPITVFANETQDLIIIWSDISLTDVNISYFNLTNRTIDNGTWITTPQTPVFGTAANQTFTVPINDLKIYINKTFRWNSTAVDGLGRKVTETHEFNVSNNPVQLAYQNLSVNLTEDQSVNIDLFRIFLDANYGYYDNLTFGEISSTDLNLSIDQGAGLLNLSVITDNPALNYSVEINATDNYGSYNETNVTVYVTPINDPPDVNLTSGVLQMPEDSYYDMANLSAAVIDPDNSLDDLNWTCSTNVTDVNATPSNITKILNISAGNNFYGHVNLSCTAFDPEGLSDTDSFLINVTPVNDAPGSFVITKPIVNENKSGNIIIGWSQTYDVDGDSINYTIEYSKNAGVWTLLGANNLTQYPDNTTTWLSRDDIPNELANISIRVNATDGTNITSAYMAGNFTLDNDAPDVFIHLPNESVIVGTEVLINVTTDEESDCIFQLNGTPFWWTVDALVHTKLYSLSAAGPYVLNISCDDDLGNTGTNSTTFTAILTNITLNSVDAEPDTGYINQTINITLDITSKYNVSTVNVSVAVPGDGIINLTRANFTPTLDGNNVNVQTVHEFNITQNIGKYNLSVYIEDIFGHNDSDTLLEEFEIFQQIIQQVNMD